VGFVRQTLGVLARFTGGSIIDWRTCIDSLDSARFKFAIDVAEVAAPLLPGLTRAETILSPFLAFLNAVLALAWNRKRRPLLTRKTGDGVDSRVKRETGSSRSMVSCCLGRDQTSVLAEM
jgi:hypothetical protein